MGKDAKGHVSFKSRFSFVEGALHSKTVFKGGDSGLDSDAPGLSTSKPRLLLADPALSA
jgi:hypothetical protein